MTRVRPRVVIAAMLSLIMIRCTSSLPCCARGLGAESASAITLRTQHALTGVTCRPRLARSTEILAFDPRKYGFDALSPSHSNLIAQSAKPGLEVRLTRAFSLTP